MKIMHWIAGLVACSLGLAQADPNLWRQQVIYLVMPDRFFNGDARNDSLGSPGCFDPQAPTKFHGGDWAGLRQKMDYLKELGVSALWVTPAYRQIGALENGSCGYHGYWADFKIPDDGAIEPKLGSKADLEGLIADLQGKGMKFILDMVVNHPGYGARITQQRPTWFHRSPGCLNQGSGTIFCPLAGLPDFAQEQPEVAAYLTAQSRGWAGRYRLDGIRMDTAKHVPLDYWTQSWVPGIRKARGKAFLVAEAFWDSSAEDLKPYFEAGFDSAFNFPLRKTLVATFAKGESVDKVAGRVKDDLATLGLNGHLMLTNLLDNHDVPRFVNEPGFGVPEDQIRRRYHLALTALFTLPGIPQLYYGNELAMYGSGDPDNRRDMPTWAWEASKRGGTYVGQALPNPQSTFALVQTLIRLRKENPALYQGYYAEMWRQNGSQNPDVYAFFRGSGANRIMVVMNNGTLESGTVSIPLQVNSDISQADRAALSDGTELRELLGAGAPGQLRVENGSVTLNLPAKTAGIYRF